MNNAQPLNGYTTHLPIIGEITALDPVARTLDVKTRGGTVFKVHAHATTYFDALKNLDRVDRRRPRPLPKDNKAVTWENLRVGELVSVEGMYYRDGDKEHYDAQVIHELVSYLGYYHFEHTRWWTTQIEVMGDRWLLNLFGDKSAYTIDDFTALYRTALNITGMPVEEEGEKQEVATLARLIYGLSSAYLMTGEDRFFHGAKAGVAFQREYFGSISADGRFCFWNHCRMKDRNGRFDVFACLFPDDVGSLPLYEQIYALAGLAQYFRITNDWEVLYDIQRTIATFNALYADNRDGVFDGFFSHLDPVEFTSDSPQLDGIGTRLQKNWNSIGDHLPAYLINLLLALDPLPQLAEGPDMEGFRKDLEKFKTTCEQILDRTAHLIATKFPQRPNAFVCERFDRDWHQNYSWGWQQNRGIVGHNLKIAWNLTRVANYYRSKDRIEDANRMFDVALFLARHMAKIGVDQIRSGVFDALEREPQNGMPIQFAWLNTKDFWQQEQGILAYLIMFGHAIQTEGEPGKPERPEIVEFLTLTRELQTFWNLFFLDRDRNGVFFRVSDNGNPVIAGSYGDKAGHAIAGYHAYELAYLANVYQRTYLPRAQRQHSGLVLHYRPALNNRFRSINVMPDFLGPNTLEIFEVNIDGVSRQMPPATFQVPLNEADLSRKVLVRYQQTEALFNKVKSMAISDTRPF